MAKEGAALRALIITAAAVQVIACGESLTFPDWTMPIPEGTRVFEYPAVPVEERDQRIELVEDLVIGDENDPNYAFFRPTDVAVDNDGRIHVVDSGNHRIQAFDRDGVYLYTLGREGQGPGEFSRAFEIARLGDRFVIGDFGNRRLSIWSGDGKHLEDNQLGGLQLFSNMVGVGELLVAGQPKVGETRTDRSVAFVSFTGEGQEAITFLELEMKLDFVEHGGIPIPGFVQAYPQFTASEGGIVYVTASEEYQVLAFSMDGQSRWALRVPWIRREVPDEDIEEFWGRMTERFPDLPKSAFEFPERYQALSTLNVDADGNLYVFPDLPRNEALRPVDVYSPEGERLFSGMIPRSSWREARGEYVYGVRLDPDTGVSRVHRWRMVKPF